MQVRNKGINIQVLKEANRIAWRSNRYAYLAYMLLHLILAGNTYLQLASTEYTINSAYNLVTGEADYRSVVIGILLFMMGRIIFEVVQICQRMSGNRLKLDITYYFEHILNKKLGSIRWDYYEDHKSFVKIHEVRRNSLETIKRFIDSTMSYMTAVPLTIIFGYYLAQINAIAVIAYIIMIIIFNRIAGNIFGKIGALWQEIQSYNQKQSYFFSLSGDKVTHQEFKFNRLYDYTQEKWEELYNEEYRVRIKIFKKHEITVQTARILFNIPYISMLIIVAYEIAMGKHEIGFLMMANQLFNRIIDTINMVVSNINNNRVDSIFLKSYMDIMAYDEDIPASVPARCNIVLKDLSYTYPQSTYKALNGLNLTIRQGEKLAIVGYNGSGKTTVTNLLMALTDHYKGSITDGFQDINLRNSISCIMQDFAQYQMTIRENIEAGNPQYHFTDQELHDILCKVGLGEVVGKLSKGIDTILGELDNGIEFSKGQWQRLAIARLLANKDATIWILDEPTAYLDPLSEIEIYNMVYELAKDRTVLYISHRLGFAKKADRIVVLDQGKVAEQGTHKELLKTEGIYTKMYRKQESWYTSFT